MLKIKGTLTLADLFLFLAGVFGIYLIVAWASYSPLDNAWSVASTFSEGQTFNKTGAFGAWLIDLLYAFWGKVAWLVPFSMTGVSLYLLILRLGSALTLKRVSLYSTSFLMMLIGLSGLAAVLLSNSPNYLAGGFIGSLWLNGLGDTLGQFVAVLLAMVLTGVGFYFCSGQTVISLLASFYEWITLKNAPAKPTLSSSLPDDEETKPAFMQEAESANVNKEDEAMPLVEADDAETNMQLTDLSHFKRPNISGLRSEPAQPLLQSEQAAQAALIDPAMFKVESNVTLPTVNVQGFDPNSVTKVEDVVGSVEMESLTLPTVRLQPDASDVESSAGANNAAMQAVETAAHFANKAVENVAPMPEWKMPTVTRVAVEMPAATEAASSISPTSSPSAMASISPMTTQPVVRMPFMEEFTSTTTEDNEAEFDFEAERMREFEEAEKARREEMEERAKAQGLEQTFENIWQNKEEKPFVVPEKPAEVPLVKMAESSAAAVNSHNAPHTPQYPKGYGETLIHPLLQRNKVMEKPTTPLPTLDLLSQHPVSDQRVTEEEIISTSRRVEAALANYGVKATVEDVLVGPVVTRYEIKPAAGVKAAKVTSLASDLARELMFKAIRITEVVPGKPYMGIETPNAHRETVWLRDVLDSDTFRNTKAILPMALGKNISGDPVVVDMTKMPHLLVAGQTGGGKSVGVNTMILSLLFKLTPEQVRFIMIDPKVVELNVYNDIPHLLTPVVTDMKKAANALRWAVEEMERRYLMVSHLRVRNIEGYNAKIDQATEMGMPIPNPLWKEGDSMDSLPPPLEKMSYIVLVVDEFADLMMSAGKEVEEHIMRIAQKARAVGIHLILATQRPSTDVITGVIKANIPSRIAFTVATQIDSRTILDLGGAESLLGRGDMLYSGAGSPEIERIHGAFMSDEDVQNVADNWRARGKPHYLDSIVASNEEDGGNRGGAGDLDELFDEVVEYVVDTGITSISSLQRRFSIGFNRAARIVDQMEAEGIVSAAGKNGKREVLAR